MRAFDLTPLYRTSVGFERLNRLFDEALNRDTAPGFPPYNIEKLGEDSYRIGMAVAGFREQDLDVSVSDNVLTVRGRIEQGEPDESRFIYRGIATRAFERRFQLADHIDVTGARLEHGLLHLDLVRLVPEELRPRKIPIGAAAPRATVIDRQAA